MKPQTKAVLKVLESGQSLTALQALSALGIGRLAARIEELRSAGYAVETTLVHAGEKRFARYRLERAAS